MVFAAGCNIYDGGLMLYNSLTKNKKRYKLKPLYPDDDVNCMEAFFKEILETIDETIDIFYGFTYAFYGNNFRKTFIELSKIQSNIKDFKIFGGRQIFLCAAIQKLFITPRSGDWLCIFLCLKEEIRCDSWKYNEEKQWKHQNSSKLEKSLKGMDKSPTVEEFQRLKSAMNFQSKTLYIFVYRECAVNEKVFKTVFSEYKKIEFSTTVDTAESALNYARYLLNENGYFKYKSDILWNKNIEIKTKDNILLDELYNTPLPFTKTVNVNSDENDVINVRQVFCELLHH